MPRSSREKSEETRARITEAAYRLFLEHGYHATSMREISEQADVSVGAIYNHFPTKEDIWLEVLATRHPYREIFPVIRAAEGETVADLVRSAARGLVRELLKRTDLLNLMFIEIVEFNATPIPDLFRQIFPEVMKMGNLFEGKRGQLREFPMPVIIRSFAGLFFSYYITGQLFRNLGGITIDEETLEQFVEIYLYGALADDDPSRPGSAGEPGKADSTPRSEETA